MNTTTNNRPTVLPLTWKNHENGNVDGNRVKVAGPVVTSTVPASQYGPAYLVTFPDAGAFMVHEDRGDWGPCDLDQWSDGHKHGLTRGKADGTLEHLGSFNTWKAAQFAAAAIAAGYDLTNAGDLAEVRRQYRARETSRRTAALNKKHGLRA